MYQFRNTIGNRRTMEWKNSETTRDIYLYFCQGQVIKNANVLSSSKYQRSVTNLRMSLFVPYTGLFK